MALPVLGGISGDTRTTWNKKGSGLWSKEETWRRCPHDAALQDESQDRRATGPDCQVKLAPALGKQRVCNLHEAGDVGAVDVIHRAILLATVLDAGGMDGLHDQAQALIDLFARP